MFHKILIANRGEIAVRIIRACKEMGVATVAIYSEADREALHVGMADESVCVGGPAVQDSYLNVTAILSAAVGTGAQAIHPGYGLLSENARFAALCAECNITFIGPGAELITLLGDKERARKTMQDAGVPVIPGAGLVPNARAAYREAKRIGLPLLIKARAGGGGRGIRRVDELKEIPAAFAAASTEAKNAFGDGNCYMERLLTAVKHVEMQIICDNHGNVVCLGERECSVQRKNQKLLEESPSMAVSADLRRKMMRKAAQAAQAVGYRNVGTIEFLLTDDGQFYFMEMNTRLQVEHPVTEMVTGIDLVKWQIRVAAGQKLDFRQQDVVIRGHAIECRINAEDPERNFMPSSGTIDLLHVPGGYGVRFDTALYQDYQVPPWYDSLLGKLIVHGQTRDEAVRKMQVALSELVIDGVKHTAELQMDILEDRRFVTGDYTTDFMQTREEHDAEI
ncbi:MAG: acetyl-CoA carboxylase biotin carboxylase subunit [Ruminococcaceae bacterium]|nr:acetyl-CoA carboxylase biotin carboxylase subunit [Oscillospiraceae bacterium]